jgi:hypothetical protein
MITQLNPPLPLETSKGGGWAHFVIDYGPEGALLWVVFMDKDGACWTVPNAEVRMCFNWTMGRRKPEDLEPAGEAAEGVAPQRFRPTLAHPAER